MMERKTYALVGTTATTGNEASWGPSIDSRPWSPGFWTQLPWTGLLALFLGAGCGIAALTVALVSDGKPLDHWTVEAHAVQSPVIVAVLVTLANAALGYAFTSGIAIFWWTSALAGRTLGHLHASQSQGASLMGLFQRRPVMNKMVATSVLMMLLLVDQPLFQRGIRVVNRSQEQAKNLTIPIPSSPLRWGATGILPPRATRPALYHPVFADVAQQFQARAPIKLPDFLCNGLCSANVVAAGFDVACTESSTNYSIMTEGDFWMQVESESFNTTYEGPENSQTMFNVSTTLDWHSFVDGITPRSVNYFIKASTLYKATAGKAGMLKKRECVMSEALVRYPVEMTGDTLTLSSMPWTVNRTSKMVSRTWEEPMDSNAPSTLGGIWLALDSQYRAQAKLYQTTSSMAIATNDTISNTYLRLPSGNPFELSSPNITWADPMDDIISTAHELALRTAIAQTNKTTWPGMGELTNTRSAPGFPHVNHTLDQEVEVTRTFTEPVYEMQPGWLAGAFAVIVLACLSIIPTYWGWWHLGRPVSLSVLEVAKAFDAPLLQQADPNGSIDEHLRVVGNTRIQYGFHAQDIVLEKIGDHETRSFCLDAGPDNDLDAVGDSRSASSQGQAGAGHSNVSPILSSTAIDNRYSVSSSEQASVEEQSISPVILEMTAGDQQGDDGKSHGENDTKQPSTPTMTDATDTNLNDSLVHQTPGGGAEAHVVESKLMFREVDRL